MQRIPALGFLLILLASCQPSTGKKASQIQLDLETVPDSVELFAPGIISTRFNERDLAISPSGKMIVWSLGNTKGDRRMLVCMEWTEKGWAEPKMLPFSGKYDDLEPFFNPSADDELYFASNRPVPGDSSRKDYNIWLAGFNEEDQWHPMFPDSVNSNADEFYPSMDEQGNLYFTSIRENGVGSEDIFMSLPERWMGGFFAPQPLDTAINTPTYEFNAFISPDGKTLIFSSYGRPDGLGGGDLYASHKGNDGSWSTARNLGPEVNSPFLDYCPFLDKSGKILFFSSNRNQLKGRKFSGVRDMQMASDEIENGLGNVYRVRFEGAE